MAMIKINENMLSDSALRELAENMLDMQSRRMLVKLVEVMNDPDVLCYFENRVNDIRPDSGKVSAIKFLREAGIELYAGSLKEAKNAVENSTVITLRQSQIDEIQKGMTGYSWQLYAVAN